MMKKLASFSSTLRFHVCCHLDMPAVSLAFSNNRHAFFLYILSSVLIAFFIWLFLTKSHSLLWQFILLYETGYKLFMVKFVVALVFKFCNVLIIENILLLILKIDGHFKILIVFKRGKTSLFM